MFERVEDFPGGPVVENPPANAEDMGSVPVLMNYNPCATLLSLCCGACEGCFNHVTFSLVHPI